jgi:3',5'-cyclic AMP phosphodiesterase CpdA
MSNLSRRHFLKLGAAGGGAVFLSGLGPADAAIKRKHYAPKDFYFVQLTDTHWGFDNPEVNPDHAGTLNKAIDAVNRLRPEPDFVVFTGDLIHTVDDPEIRRQRMLKFKDIVSALKVDTVRYLPGEHDAALDGGALFQELFGPLYGRFEHKGVQFFALDNVSDPKGQLGETQLAWLQRELQLLNRQAPIVVLAHRPLFNLHPEWEWTTRDGQAAIDLLQPHRDVTVFYGHIHQEHHHATGHIHHHAATSLIFPQPAPGSAPQKAPVPWDKSSPYRGLGYRVVETGVRKKSCDIEEHPLARETTHGA